MNRQAALVVAMTLLSTVAVCSAGHDEDDSGHTMTWLNGISERDTLTDNWFALGEKLAEEGITVSVSLTQIYQLNLQGGISTHRHKGRYTGSYDLEGEFDLGKLLKLPGATIYAHAEGSWSEGLDAGDPKEASVGSLFGVNGDAAGGRSIDLTELFYEQALFNDKLRFRIGKLDISGGFDCRGCPVSFDGSSYANDETTQFLNGALVNNPTIPMPDVGLGAIVYFNPVEWWYASGGVADAQADGRETGFNTAFHGPDYFFAIFETGVAPQIRSGKGPLQGTYRVGFWYDPQPKDKFDGSGVKRDDLGFYLTFDQMVWKENAGAENTQGLGVFTRYGYAHADVNEIRHFWSVGGQYQGLIPTRDDDVLAFGVAQGRLVREAGFTADHETAMELYYNIAVTPWLSVSPSAQYILNPGGDGAVGDAVVVGFRMQITF